LTHDAAVKAAARAVTEDTGPITVWRNRMDNRYLTKFGDALPKGDQWLTYSVVGIDGVEVALGTNQTAEAKAIAATSSVELPAAVADTPLTYTDAVQAVAQFLVARPELLHALATPPIPDDPTTDVAAPTLETAKGVATHG
jgi:hypothetical protein